MFSLLSAPDLETQPDKWSSEAIALRSKARPWRMEKLKMAELLNENPGLDFLMEWWQDDPASADCNHEVGEEVSAVGLCGCGLNANELG